MSSLVETVTALDPETMASGGTIFAPVLHNVATNWYNDGVMVSNVTESGVLAQVAYDALRRETVRIDGRGNVSRTRYDAFGRVAETIDALTNATAYAYDAAGRRIARAHSGTAFVQPDMFNYAYNAKSELTNAVAVADSNYTYAYDFDEIGNRRTSSECGVRSAEYTANELNQYTAISTDTSALSASPRETFTPQFDADGNQTLVKTATGIWQVNYNGENRPILWTCGETNIVMSYDRMGRRVTKSVECGGQSAECCRFVYDGYLQIANHHSTSTPTPSPYTYFIWDPTEPVATRPLVWFNSALDTPHSALYYSHDGNKNVSEVVAQDGVIAAHYEYAPFGAVTAQSGALAMANPWRFSSEFSDDELGCDYYNYREYEPMTGRWMSRDPVGEGGGLNTVGYVGNRIMNAKELLGLSTVHSICVDAVRNAMKSREYKNCKKYLDDKAKVKKGVARKKCEVKIYCGCCPGVSRLHEGGNYVDDEGVVTVCENKLYAASDRDEFARTVLHHEMLHAIQNCDGAGDDSCENSICREIHAYYNANTLGLGREDEKRIATLEGALLSSAKKMTDIFDNKYDSCKSKWITK